MKKKPFFAVCMVALFLVFLFSISSSLVRAPVSNEEAIGIFLRENFGQSRTSWLDTIDSITSTGDTVIVRTSKSRHNDALDICEAVSKYVFSSNVTRPRVTNIEVRASNKVIARRYGEADHCTENGT
jgi:hypothetical protein